MSSDRKIYKAHNNLLLIAMYSIIMLFAGLTSAYIVSKGALGSNWDIITLPTMFYISTAVIIISSFFLEGGSGSGTLPGGFIGKFQYRTPRFRSKIQCSRDF